MRQSANLMFLHKWLYSKIMVTKRPRYVQRVFLARGILAVKEMGLFQDHTIIRATVED